MTKQITSLTEVTTTEDGDLLLIRDATDGVDKKMQAQNLRAKATTKDDVGLGNVPNLDTTDAVNKAHDQNTDTALDQGGLNEVTAADARAHIDSTANPHGVTKTQVGLGDVDNVSAADLRDRSTHTGTQTLSTISDAGTIASQDANSVNIDGGTIDGTAVNATTLTASGDVNFDSGTLFVDASTDRVGIGNTSPSAALDVRDAGTDAVINLQQDTSDFACAIDIKAVNANGSRYNRITSGALDGTGDWAIGRVSNNVNNNFGIWTAATERMRIDSSGNVGIGTTSPAKDLDVSGEIRASSGILFGTDTAADNTLDDYETGTWTPVIEGTDTAGTAAYFKQYGEYVKVGRQLFLQFDVRWGSGTGTGFLSVFGVPFASSASNFSIAPIASDSVNLPVNTTVYSIITGSRTSLGFGVQPVGGGASAGLNYDTSGILFGQILYFV